MRSSSFTRGVIASLGVSVVITLGCGNPMGGPSPRGSFSVSSISPTEGSSVLATVAKIVGTGFQSGDTVTVDGIRVDATVLSVTTISLTMPAHAAGKVTLTVINPLSQAQASVPTGFLYFAPPVVSELVPNTGSTAGGAPVSITGPEVGYPATLTVDGILTPFDQDFLDGGIYLTMPAHAAGTVEVILTDRWGQAGTAEFTYASPATFDFNGDWEGSGEPVPREWGTRLLFTIRDNTAVSILCLVCRDSICAIGSAPSLTLDPPPVVADGEFSFAGSGVSITGKILSPKYASGSLNMASCGSRQWTAYKKPMDRL